MRGVSGSFPGARDFPWRRIAIGCSLALWCCEAHATIGAERPNIIVIFSDDHGWSDLASQGVRDDLRTPHLDRLAAGGLRATDAYVTAPQCVPSRAGLLTGRYQNRFGVESNAASLDGFAAQQTIAERLQEAGYATGMTGKWHLGPPQEITRHGFQDVFYKIANRPGWANFDLEGGDRTPGPEDTALYHLDANTAAACAFIRRHHRQPFFFYCAYRAPHVPLDAPSRYLDRFPGEMPNRRRQALAMISAMDDGVGRILETLREHGLEEKTLIFFLGDNGAPLKIHRLDEPGGGAGWDGSLNDPLNGEKGMLTEGGIRVPWLAYWKGTIPAGQVFSHPVISLDIAATAAALAGIEAAGELDGVDLTPSFTGQGIDPPHAELYWRWVAQAAVRSGDWKLLRGGTREYLFDLRNDPAEKHDLSRKHPDLAARLRRKLTAWAEGLQPAGLSAGEMSATWEQYFDVYLDGKPAPPPPGDREATSSWVARNARTRVTPDGLQVTPQPGGGRPFLAFAGLRVPADARVRVTFRAAEDGALGVQWRAQGQRDFLADQAVEQPVSAASEFQQATLALASEAPVIHLRLRMPGGGGLLQRLEILDSQGRRLKDWNFR